MKIVISDVYDLKYNYGVQGLVLPLTDKIRKYTDAEFIMPVQSAYFNEPNIEFAREKGITMVSYWKYSFIIDIFHILLKFLKIISFSTSKKREGKSPRTGPLSLYLELAASVQGADMVIDVAGIEFIGNSGIINKWGELLFTRMFQKMSKRYDVPYFKYTKSYGPLDGVLFRLITKRMLEELPFIFIRGRNNLEKIEQLDLETPLHLFPDVSLVLKPSPKEKSIDYLESLGINTNFPIAGISPSRVLSKITSSGPDNSVGINHQEMIKRFISEYKNLGYQVLVIPHAIDRIDINKCDRQLSIELLNEAGETENVFLTGEELSYSDVRAIIGQLSFYVTGRYHSVASALYMGIPVVSLSWHIKYTDIMGEFLDDFLAIDCRNTGIEEAFGLIRKYHDDMSWFDRGKMRANKQRIDREIDRSIKMILEYSRI